MSRFVQSLSLFFCAVRLRCFFGTSTPRDCGCRQRRRNVRSLRRAGRATVAPQLSQSISVFALPEKRFPLLHRIEKRRQLTLTKPAVAKLDDSGASKVPLSGLRNDLYCVGWGVKLYSNQTKSGLSKITIHSVTVA